MIRMLAVATFLGIPVFGCTYGIISTQTGGHGQVLMSGRPLAGATVSVTGLDGTLATETDADGSFDIPVQSKRALRWLMDNPIIHDVQIKITKEEIVLYEEVVSRSVFGENYLNFGKLEVQVN